MGDPERPDRLRPLPGRLQHQRDDARGEGEADPLAQPSRGRRGLALRQGPLRLRASARRRPDPGPARRGQGRALRAARVERRARPRRGDAARRAAPRPSPRSRARRRSSRPTGSRSSSAPGSARTRPCCRRRSPTSSTRSARRSPRSATRRRSSSSATSPSLERAPIVDLWIKAARRNGATVLCEQPEGKVEGAVLISDDAVSAPPGSRATSAPPLPSTCRARRTAAASPTPGAPPPTASRSIVEPALVVISGDEAALDPGVRALAERANAVIGIGMFEESFRGLADLVLPGHELPRARRHHRQPRGPPAAPAPRGDRAVPRRARLDREARGALRRRALAARLARLRGGRRRAATAASRSATSASTRRCPPPAEARADPWRRRATKTRRRGQGSAAAHVQAALLRARGRAHARARLPAPRRRGRAGPRRRAGQEDRRGRRSCGSRRTARPSTLRARIARDLPAGAVRIPRATPPACTSSSR